MYITHVKEGSPPEHGLSPLHVIAALGLSADLKERKRGVWRGGYCPKNHSYFKGLSMVKSTEHGSLCFTVLFLSICLYVSLCFFHSFIGLLSQLGFTEFPENLWTVKDIYNLKHLFSR